MDKAAKNRNLFLCAIVDSAAVDDILAFYFFEEKTTRHRKVYEEVKERT